jgi:hypothetical protein
MFQRVVAKGLDCRGLRREVNVCLEVTDERLRDKRRNPEPDAAMSGALKGLEILKGADEIREVWSGFQAEFSPQQLFVVVERSQGF